MVAGLLLRLHQYVYNRALWGDESSLAVNIVERDFAGLLQPLERSQGAPVGFLLVEELATRVLGEGEMALRLLPLVSGAAALVLLYVVARRWLTDVGAAVALGLFAVLDPLVHYSTELKQYSTDAAVAVALLLLLDALLEERSTGRRLVVGACVGAGTLWLSHPAAFVLAGAGVALLVDARRRPRGRLVGLAIIGVAWVASFAVLYVVSLRHLRGNSYLQRFWSDAFVPLPPRSAEELRWPLEAFFGFFSGAAGFAAPGLAALLALLGAVVFAADRRGRLLLVGLVLPAVLAFLASALRLYPFQGRLLLFLVPGALILIAAGVHRLLEGAGPWGRRAGALAIVLLAIHPTAEAVAHLAVPRRHEEIRPLFERLQREAGGTVYVSYGAWAAFRYYRTRYDLDGFEVVRGRYASDDWNRYVEEIRALRGRGPVWFLFSGISRSEGQGERFVRWHLEQVATHRETVRERGVVLHLYEM